MHIKNIKVKLLAAFAIPVLFIVILGYISYNKALYGIVSNFEKAASNTVDATGSYLNLGLQSVQATASELCAGDNLKFKEEYGSYKSIHKSIIAKLAADKFMSNIHVFSQDSVAISTKMGAMKEDIFTDFVKSQEAAHFTETDDYIWVGTHPYIDSKFKTDTSKYGLSIISKVKSTSGFSESGGKVIGFVVIDINPEAVKGSLNSFSLGEGSFSGFITSDGREMNTLTDQKPYFTKQDFYNKTLAGTNKNGYEYVSSNGKQYLFLYTKVDMSGSLLCTMIPKASILKQANDIKVITIIFVIIASLIAILIGTLMSTGIGNAIKQMVKALGQASEGNLTTSIKLKRKDELAYLADHLNKMFTSMRILMDKVTKVSSTVSTSTGEVKSTAGELYHSTKDITMAIGEIEKGMENQAFDTENCLKQMNYLSERINQVNDSTFKIDKIATGTQSVTGEGFVLIGELNNRTQATTDIAKSVIRNIEALEEESQTIADITQVIDEIAEQTNLLSLNASIEAARAGEAGKGFAVVAEAVRRLAEKSLDASKQIQEIIKAILDHTKQTASSAKEAETIVTLQNDALQKTIRVFSDIRLHVEELAGNLKGITSEVGEIEEVKNSTLQTMTDISAVAQQTVAVTEQIIASANNQLTAVQALNDTVERLSVDTAALDEAVIMFHI